MLMYNQMQINSKYYVKKYINYKKKKKKKKICMQNFGAAKVNYFSTVLYLVSFQCKLFNRYHTDLLYKMLHKYKSCKITLESVQHYFAKDLTVTNILKKLQNIFTYGFIQLKVHTP